MTWQLADLYAPVAEELAQVESILRREMRSKYSFVDELVRYGCLLGGKRLRPRSSFCRPDVPGISLRRT